jgi:hypothetical protein
MPEFRQARQHDIGDVRRGNTNEPRSVGRHLVRITATRISEGDDDLKLEFGHLSPLEPLLPPGMPTT